MHKIIIGDCLEVMSEMDSESIDLIATDPPFNTGRDFGDYSDQFDSDDAYLEWLRVRLMEMHRLLKPTGSIYLHCDQNMSHYIKVEMDKIWGRTHFRNEIVWRRSYAKNDACRKYAAITDHILFYSKSINYFFAPQRLPPDALKPRLGGKRRVEVDTGRVYEWGPIEAPRGNPNTMFEFMGVKPPPKGWSMRRAKLEALQAEGRLESNGTGDKLYKKIYQDERDGPPISNVWDDILLLNAYSKERTGYATQKPVALYERIIKGSCPEGGRVLDPFMGSGTTIIAALNGGREAIGIEQNPDAGKIAARRLTKRSKQTHTFL